MRKIFNKYDAGFQGLAFPHVCSFSYVTGIFLFLPLYSVVYPRYPPFARQEPLDTEHLTSDSKRAEHVSSDENRAGIPGLWVSRD